jgi:hypothetical protein
MDGWVTRSDKYVNVRRNALPVITGMCIPLCVDFQ